MLPMQTPDMSCWSLACLAASFQESAGFASSSVSIMVSASMQHSVKHQCQQVYIPSPLKTSVIDQL